MGESGIHIGGRLREIRKRMNLTQLDFSNVLKTSAGFISEVESGKKQCGIDLLFSLKRNFNISIDWFLTGRGTMFETHKPDGENTQIEQTAQIQRLEVEKQKLLEENLQLKAQVEVLKELIVKLKTS